MQKLHRNFRSGVLRTQKLRPTPPPGGALPTDKASSVQVLMSAFPVHSTSFPPKRFQAKDYEMSGTVKRLRLAIR